MFRFVAILIAFGALLLVQTESSRAQSLPTTTFKVKKIVTNSAGGAIGGYTYPISISCTGPTTTSANPSLAANGQHTMGGVMYTSVCTVSENVANFQVPAQYDCPSGNVPTWQAPVYSPGPSLTIGPVYMQTSNTITVTNQLKCAKVAPKTGSLLIRKSIDNPYHANLNGISFGMAVKCGGTTYPTFTLSITNPQNTLTAIPVGVSCKVTELTPNLPAPVASCAKPKKLVWLPPVYTPATAIIASGSTVNLSVVNKLDCQLPNVGGPKTLEKKKGQAPSSNDPKGHLRTRGQDTQKPAER